MDKGNRQATIVFADGRTISVEFPIQAGEDKATIMANLRKGLESDRLLIEVDGDLMIIPMANVTSIRIHPAPEALPMEIIRGAKLIS